MKNIKLERTQSLLKELIPMALANLNDTRLNSLNVVEVKCSKGKYSAQVFLESSFLTTHEQAEILNQLKKARNLIKEYCLEETGWFRCPDFQFFFDDSLERENRLDKIFHAIALEKEKRNNNVN
ncbi:30S ribosome-binding factor RbfA [Helicobacter sp.]|uniref:30S ribosome-binding factor RbfA n=1 Tax=Helicobacter sp. TaxID=218 RepID=UPI00258EDFDF|nr:30S ribosome-binding factor RbfA [Helicobacter sp.]MCI7765059.1 30S ribosome-binding factor RbfA [Helicobacter sp.]